MRDINLVIRSRLFLIWILNIFLFILTVGCSGNNLPNTSGVALKSHQENSAYYEVFGKRYYPMAVADGFKQTGVASWYGPNFHGKKTSNGEIFDMYQMTAAHKRLPLPSTVRVTNLENSKQIVVRVNDRGPFVDGRIIDLSFGAAKALGFDKKGTERVDIEVVFGPDVVFGNNATSLYPDKIVYQLGAFNLRKNALNLQQTTIVKLGNRYIVDVIESKDNLFKVWLVLSINEELLSDPDSFFDAYKIRDYSRVY